MWPDQVSNPGSLARVRCPADCAMRPGTFMNETGRVTSPESIPSHLNSQKTDRRTLQKKCNTVPM